jgi:hypothetical protein
MPEKNEIILFSGFTSGRMEYTVRFISARIGVDMEIVPAGQLTNDAKNSVPACLHFGSKPVEGDFSIFDSGLLHETGIKSQEIAVARNNHLTMLFPAPQGFDLPFDIFSAVFYLLSRYEEYLPFIPDGLGRFEADQSLAHRHGFLEEPVIDQWIELLKSELLHRYPGLAFPARKFHFISTLDIDNPWAYLHKGMLRTLGGMLKTMIMENPGEIGRRIKVLRRKLHDPYDNYLYIKNVEKQYRFNSIFFFLSGSYGGYDTNYALNTGYFKELVRGLARDKVIGIHPSYKSNFNPELLETEFDHFSEILGHKPHVSRQHFLMVKFPETYRSLISRGIRGDYSMGYASKPGFRAGTTIPYRFYDLTNEQETDLIIFPFAVMDVTLRQYMRLTPEKALEAIRRIAGKVRKVNGTFISLWHNESLSDSGVWKDWRRVFEGMVQEAARDE